jgi:hypothetical protein
MPARPSPRRTPVAAGLLSPAQGAPPWPGDLAAPPQQPPPSPELLSRLFGAFGRREPAPDPEQPGPTANQPIVCRGVATYTAVGPRQATLGGALAPYGVRPDDGTVAVGDPVKIFGLNKRSLAKIAPQIQIVPTGLDGQLTRKGGPLPPYSVGDIGDPNIRNSPGTRFDIYRFLTQRGARRFSYPAPTTMTMPNVPGLHCPPDFTRVR